MKRAGGDGTASALNLLMGPGEFRTQERVLQFWHGWAEFRVENEIKFCKQEKRNPGGLVKFPVGTARLSVARNGMIVNQTGDDGESVERSVQADGGVRKAWANPTG